MPSKRAPLPKPSFASVVTQLATEEHSPETSRHTRTQRRARNSGNGFPSNLKNTSRRTPKAKSPSTSTPPAAAGNHSQRVMEAPVTAPITVLGRKGKVWVASEQCNFNKSIAELEQKTNSTLVNIKEAVESFQIIINLAGHHLPLLVRYYDVQNHKFPIHSEELSSGRAYCLATIAEVLRDNWNASNALKYTRDAAYYYSAAITPIQHTHRLCIHLCSSLSAATDAYLTLSYENGTPLYVDNTCDPQSIPKHHLLAEGQIIEQLITREPARYLPWAYGYAIECYITADKMKFAKNQVKKLLQRANHQPVIDQLKGDFSASMEDIFNGIQQDEQRLQQKQREGLFFSLTNTTAGKMKPADQALSAESARLK